MRMIDLPVVGKYLYNLLPPHESYPFWDHYFRGFSQTHRDLFAEDVTPRTRQSLTNALSQILTLKRNRLLLKITGWPRLGFIQEIFTDTKFIHIIRDGRAVANSLINVSWWPGWRGPAVWYWGALTPQQQAEWKKYNYSYLVLAAIGWKILMDAMEKAKSLVPAEQFLEIKYEELCANPTEVFRRVVDFCELSWEGSFEKEIRRYPVHNTNFKWQKELTQNQQRILNEVLETYLKRYGYL